MARKAHDVRLGEISERSGRKQSARVLLSTPFTWMGIMTNSGDRCAGRKCRLSYRDIEDPTRQGRSEHPRCSIFGH